MDNFMDKLTKRFNAGEMIQANGEAEARENDRLHKQNEENDKILKEIRRLNLKTIEVSEQVSQMAAASIEQIESYRDAIITTEDSLGESLSQEALLKELSDVKDKLSEMESLKMQIMQISEKTIDSMRLTDDTLRRVDEVNQKTTELGRKTDDLGNAVSNASNLLKRDLTDVSYRLDASLSQLEEEVAQNRKAIDNTLSQIRSDLQNQSDKGAEVDGLFEEIEELFEKQDQERAENAKQIKEMIASLRLYVEEVQKHIEDYVHKEDVKVYRNVQAVITQQFSDRARELNLRMDQMEASKGKGTGVKIMLFLLFLLSGGTLAIQILQILGII